MAKKINFNCPHCGKKNKELYSWSYFPEGDTKWIKDSLDLPCFYYNHFHNDSEWHSFDVCPKCKKEIS